MIVWWLGAKWRQKEVFLSPVYWVLLYMFNYIYTKRLSCVGIDVLTFDRRWRNRNIYVFTKRHEVGTTVFRPGVVAKVIAVTQRVQYRYGTVILPTFATASRPGRAVSACDVGTVFQRRHTTKRHHHYGDHGGRRRHL